MAINSSKMRWLLPLIGVTVIGGLALAATSMKKAGSSGDPESKLTHIVKRGDVNVTVIEQGGLESSKNIEIKCQVRGKNIVNWVIENGTHVEPGDVLVRLDTLAIEDAINERSKYAHWSRSGAESSKANLARSKLAINEYLDGRFVTQKMTLEKNLAIAESNLLIATNMLDHAKKLAKRGFAKDFEIEQRTIAVEQAELEVDARKTDLEVLEKYSKAMQMKTLEGNLNSAQATHNANEERAILDEKRAQQAKDEFKLCVIKAEKSGLVIFPSAAAWKASPDIEEGATVHKDQVLLLMPDLMRMQTKVGIHESIVDRIEPGMKARVSIPDAVIEGEVLSVASVAQPAGWWTGNVVKYETIIGLPEGQTGLKPGMSAEVEIMIANNSDVIRIPVSAVLETPTETLCWIKQADGRTQRRKIEIGDSNDVFIVVKDGLSEGEEVVLNPVASIKEAQDEALNAMEETEAERQAKAGSSASKPQTPSSDD